MDNKKIIDRIKNLLDMASDAGSPNEAMIAAKRARSLMDKHQITKDEVLKACSGDDFLESPSGQKLKQHPTWMKKLCHYVGELNDCVSVMSHWPEPKFKFRGFKSDAIIATYTFDYLCKTAKRLCDASEAKGRSERNFYLLGFVDAISMRIREIVSERKANIKADSGTSLMIIKTELINAHFGELKGARQTRQRRPTGEEMTAQRQGFEDGNNVSLEKQIDQPEKTKQLN